MKPQTGNSINTNNRWKEHIIALAVKKRKFPPVNAPVNGSIPSDCKIPRNYAI